ncbi:hypothetical protein, partial [Desulfocurvus sp. DL9XJH121]
KGGRGGRLEITPPGAAVSGEYYLCTPFPISSRQATLSHWSIAPSLNPNIYFILIALNILITNVKTVQQTDKMINKRQPNFFSRFKIYPNIVFDIIFALNLTLELLNHTS